MYCFPLLEACYLLLLMFCIPCVKTVILVHRICFIWVTPLQMLYTWTSLALSYHAVEYPFTSLSSLACISFLSWISSSEACLVDTWRPLGCGKLASILIRNLTRILRHSVNIGQIYTNDNEKQPCNFECGYLYFDEVP